MVLTMALAADLVAFALALALAAMEGIPRRVDAPLATGALLVKTVAFGSGLAPLVIRGCR